MGYADRDDVDEIFGKASVVKWADLNNKRIAIEIKARYDWALALSKAKLDSRLRDGPYTIPFSTPADPIIIDLEARMAGVLLYDGRRIADDEDEDSTQDIHRVMIDSNIRMILAGQLRLDVDTVAVNYPQVIPQ